MLTPKVANIISIVVSLLIVVGFSIKIFLDYRNYQKLKNNTIFPPWPAKCPDYWLVKEDSDDKLVCKNINKIGVCKTDQNDDEMDFGDVLFKGEKGPIYKCNWSKKCESPWEGIDSMC